ncbi:MAG: hypothetical protein ACLSAC_10160 [Enterocloster bolteae]
MERSKIGGHRGKPKKLIRLDGEAEFLSHYIQKGFTPEYLLSMGLSQKLFFVASMRLEQKREEEYFKALCRVLSRRR